jgi:N-acetylmuramoyl-L-alanine amidase
MAGCISRQYRARSKRIAPILGSLIVASAMSVAGDKTPDPADARVTAVRYWSLGETTRIAIEVSSEFRFKYERLNNPDRLFFDIFGAKPEMAARGVQVIPVDDGIVKQLRVAETQPGVTRIVIDLKQDAELSTSQLSNPNRLMVEVKSADAKSVGDKSKDRPSPPAASGVINLGATGAQKLTAAAPPAAVLAKTSAIPLTEKAKTTKQLTETASVKESPKPVESLKPSDAKPSSAKSSETKSGDNKPVMAASPKYGFAERPIENRVENRAENREEAAGTSFDRPTTHPVTAVQNTAAAKSTELIASLPPEPVGVEPPSSADPSPVGDVKEVLPAKRGAMADRSLTRALGLKLGRVVIDAGHGGNDVGAHGPSGYLEKDLTLDVARRLAELVRNNMGSDVVLTRSEDVYVGLEERTRLANEHKADLFLSIHANSSPYRSAAGVETYVLSFTTSKTAMDLASRENAGSELGIHDLQDLLQKIALRDKVEESHEFAGRLQTSLSVLSAKSNDAAKNRGVKKAPFVVLIGANMPSVLAEIGFLTNPAEESLLRKPEHRQKIAEALYKGISSYADTLSQVVARKN